MKTIDVIQIVDSALRIRNMLKETSDVETNRITTELLPIAPFVGGPDIRCVIIGQDPTIRNVEQRKKITTTLNLDKGGSLKSYISKIVDIKHVYATNIFKYFYTKPPAGTFEVLERHLVANLELLKFELSYFKDLPIILLGQPVLKLLTGNGSKVRDCWGYDEKTGRSTKEFNNVTLKDNLGVAYPFPHQPSISKPFYAENIAAFINYFKSMCSNCN